MLSLAEVSESKEYILDLTWFHLEGEMNNGFAKKGVPTRFVCCDINSNVISVSRNGHVVALYLRDVKRLYRIDGSLMLQWCMIRNAFTRIFDGIIVVE